MNITISEMREMKRMGYTVKAMYKTARGIPFHKFFTNKDEFERFTASAEECGTRLTGSAERSRA